MESASNYAEYTESFPIWINDNEIYCDEAQLKQHLVQKLNYDENRADRLVKEVNKLVNDIMSSVNCLWQVTTETGDEGFSVALESTGGYRLRFKLANYHKKTDLMKMIIQCDCIHKDTYFQLLCSKGWITERTPLHIACERGDTECVKSMLQHVPQDKKFSLLLKRDHRGRTPLHNAANSGHADIMKVIYDSVTKFQWVSLLQDGMDKPSVIWGPAYMTVLQTAVYQDKQTSVEFIRNSVSDDIWLQLLCTRCLHQNNSHTYHAWHYNRHNAISPVTIHSPGYYPWDENKVQLAAICIDELRVEARVKSVLTNDADKELQIKNIAETESLTVEQIQLLSSHGSQYIIPYKQQESKRYGLILFSSEDRQGAFEEADGLEQALRATECDVIKMEWFEAVELHNMIDSAMTRIAGDCSLLIVCLMSHGSRGVLSGSCGGRVTVNDVLHQLTLCLPSNMCIPMVVLIQACQAADRTTKVPGSDPAPTQVSDPHRDQHITLTRPHTVLLLATVRDGLAYRGLFTGAMADEFRSADGSRDIYTMFTTASSKVSTSTNQQPLVTSTLSKKLILPPAIQAPDT